MKNNKWALGLGLAVTVGFVFWMRALASWRPQTFGIVDFTATKLHLSKDGRHLLVEDIFQQQGAIFSLDGAQVDTDAEHIRDFATNHGLQSYPRVWWDEAQGELIFSPERNRRVLLSGVEGNDGLTFLSYEAENSKTAWSKERREVYYQWDSEVWIWDWNTGQLKKRVRYMKAGTPETTATFSPDGKWVLAFEQLKDRNGFLRLYDVQSGKMVALVNQCPDFRAFGFSPDSRLIWFAQDTPGVQEFNIIQTADSKYLWSAECAGPVKWLPDGRIGLVQKSGFQWRDAVGRKLQSLPGPSKNVSDWVLSADGDWIYSCEISRTVPSRTVSNPRGIIRRWRAR